MTTAIVLSLLAHILVMMMLQTRLWRPRSEPAEEMVDVDLVELPPPPPKPKPKPAVAPPPPAAPPVALKMPESAIVPMPDAGIEKANENARFQSDRDNTVEQEAVHRGPNFDQAGPAKQQGESPVDVPKPAVAPKSEIAKAEKAAVPRPPEARKANPPPRPPQVASLPKLEQLLPRAGDFAVPPPVSGRGRESEPPPAPPRNLLATGRQDALSSRAGVAAYLPTVKEGDITMLNTKASQFAPFVRRVAARVFQHLEIALRQAASGIVAGTGREYAEVEAVMSPRGELVSAILRQRKSETQLGAYRLLLNSANGKVFFDRNPPSAAVAADGNIHFLLAIDLAVDIGVDPDSGRKGTNYYGIAGVGLE